MPTVLGKQWEVKWSWSSRSSPLSSRRVTPCGGGWEAHGGKEMSADGEPHEDKSFEITANSLFLKKPLEGFTFSVPAYSRPF